MIRINLLEGPRRKPSKTAATFGTGQKLTMACSLILVATVLLLGWRYRLITTESARLDSEIASAQQEATRLRAIITEVQRFEQRRAQLQQRVALIEQLRRDQTGPVHMLDQISRALPPLLWLTQLKQTAAANEVLIDGRCSTLTSLSDFVTNLESSGYFQRSIEIVSTETETSGTPPAELIKFQIKAVFRVPSATPAASPPGRSGN